MVPRVEDDALVSVGILLDELVTGEHGVRRKTARRQIEVPLVVGEKERSVVRAVDEEQPELVIIDVR